MKDAGEERSFVVDLKKLRPLFPTHGHSPIFWENLGRTIATFGFLEEVLGKAIFSFTATTLHEESEIDAAYQKWLPTLERAITDPLGHLIDAYGKAVRNNSAATIENLDLEKLLGELREASVIRNILCHGSWSLPDKDGKSLPFFVNKQKMKWNTPIGTQLGTNAASRRRVGLRNCHHSHAHGMAISGLQRPWERNI